MTLVVLLVDDDDQVRHALGRVLERRGYTVLTANGADSAHALLHDHVVDAVVMDLNMPDIPGEVLYFTMVARWPYLRGRIAIMSGNLGGADALPSELTACPALPKPFSFELLEQTITLLAGGEERRRQNGT